MTKLTRAQQDTLALFWPFSQLQCPDIASERFFAATDRVVKVYEKTVDWADLIDLAAYKLLQENAHWLPVSVELWKEDFKKGLLFLSDFDFRGTTHEKALAKLALKTYNTCNGFETSYAKQFAELLKE